MGWRDLLGLVLLTATATSFSFWVEPMWELGDWRWGVSAAIPFIIGIWALDKEGAIKEKIKSFFMGANRYVSKPDIKHVGRYIGYGLGYLIAFVVIGLILPDLVKAFGSDVIIRFYHLAYKIVGIFMVLWALMAFLFSRNSYSALRVSFFSSSGS